MTTSVRISILISTKGAGIKNMPALLLEPRPDVCYIISFQYDGEEDLKSIPSIVKQRGDVELITQKGAGLSRSRNFAIEHCHTPYALLADDDVVYKNDYLDEVLSTFEKHPETTIFCFQLLNRHGQPYKNYPGKPFSYRNRPYGYYFTSPEIGFRMHPELPRFNERFGLGSSYLICGEEEVFLYQSYRYKKLNICYFPVVCCRITKDGTGRCKNNSPAFFRSKGAVLYVLHGLVGAVLRCTKEALCVQKELPPLSALRYMLQGLRYIRK